ncbi:glucokinase [Gloeothece citriformis PCC 7424]|uniref:Glucokinase n=1 Tax=Gloeothece citriformis (strain PCC 7424) TaxID=65393 RepID=B7KIR8_GLOC7|nr:glucokinase [Gloeothece citriformis]ACK70754.1 glucokinase [Gloeothece citriformis PCC 7424]
MTILLAGDIGGTKTILRLVQSDPTETLKELPKQTTLWEDTYPSQNFPDLVPIVRKFMQEATDKLAQTLTIEQACFGIAGPVVDNTSELTNLSWSLSGDRLAKELNINKVSLINDFAAIGYGVIGLTSDDICTLQEGERDSHAPIAILGAGTGLGEGYLIPLSDGSYRVCPSEGSHADFPPRSTTEFQLLNYIREHYNIDRVSVERVVSGQGIVTIYEFLRHQDPSQESSYFAPIYQAWERELGKGLKTIDLAAEISKAATEQSDYLCQQTMKLFLEAYGAEAGNLCLKLLPYGGLYVAGGITAKNIALMQQGNFMKAFSHKGRVSPLLRKIPVHLVLNPKVGLIGAALRAAQL